MDSGYSFIEHTADVGLSAWGRDPAEAFAQAALGMFAIVLGTDPLSWDADGAPAAVEVAVAGQNWDELLVNWLAELLFHFEIDHFIPRRVDFADCAPPRCRASVAGIRPSSLDSLGGVGIKAVTYHQLDVQIAPGRAAVRVIFDI
jgi:SHS2 domain-containing protein